MRNANPRWFVDRQNGPECGFEAIENAIQHFHPVTNQISETILKHLARQNGLLATDGSLNPLGYQLLLRKYRIQSSWHAFDHNLLIRALNQTRVVVAIVDAHHVDGRYPYGSGHALLVTDVVWHPQTGVVTAYAGFDSNFHASKWRWDANAFEIAARYYAPNSLLLTQPRPGVG